MSLVLLHLAVPRLVQIPTVNQVKQGGSGVIQEEHASRLLTYYTWLTRTLVKCPFLAHFPPPPPLAQKCLSVVLLIHFKFQNVEAF